MSFSRVVVDSSTVGMWILLGLNDCIIRAYRGVWAFIGEFFVRERIISRLVGGRGRWFYEIASDT